jgi:hypothetical protein
VAFVRAGKSHTAVQHRLEVIDFTRHFVTLREIVRGSAIAVAVHTN